MNKLLIAVGAISILTASGAFANFQPGRVDTLVSCKTTLVNGYSIDIENVEGTQSYTAHFSHGGTIGQMPVANPIEVKIQYAKPPQTLTTVVDAATGGQNFKLVTNPAIVQPQDSLRLHLNAVVNAQLPAFSVQNLSMFCFFPVRPM